MMRGQLLQKNNHPVPLQKEISNARVIGEAELKLILSSFNNNSLSSVHLVVTNRLGPSHTIPHGDLEQGKLL